MVLRGIFLASAEEIDWFMHGMRKVFPEAWERFASFLPSEERGDLLANYHKRLVDPDPAVHGPAAAAWDAYESDCSTLLPRGDGPPAFESDAIALAIARIEAHYFVHSGFLADGELLGNIHRIEHLPCTIVQGRYDVVCPPVTALALSRAWPSAELVVVPTPATRCASPGSRASSSRRSSGSGRSSPPDPMSAAARTTRGCVAASRRCGTRARR
jgi:proline iminopeptidase